MTDGTRTAGSPVTSHSMSLARYFLATGVPVDQFSFTRQTTAFLGILAILELALVLVFPTATVLLGVIAAGLIVLVWMKAGIRTRKWLWWNPVAVPLTQAEGAVALSATLMFAAGILVAGYEAVRFASGEKDLLTGYAFRQMLKEGPPRTLPVGSRAVHYSDPEMLTALKYELAKAGVPFKLDTREGKEYVVWTPEHNAVAEEIQRKLHEGPPAGGSVHFAQPATQQAFREWLLKRGIASEIVIRRGEEYVDWKEGPRELAKQFLQEYYRPCPEDEAASASAKAGQARC
jgi:hypothetical protein